MNIRFATALIACFSFLTSSAIARPCFDFTGSGRTSFATLSGLNDVGPLTWNILDNGGDGHSETFNFGRGGIEPLHDGIDPGYFDADAKADAGILRVDMAVPTPIFFHYRPSTQVVSNPQASVVQEWGQVPDRSNALAADYDGDGRDDLAVARPNSNGRYTWLILRSSTYTMSAVQFGLSSDWTIAGADYNGDGRADITVIRDNTPSVQSSTYFAGDSETGEIVKIQNWGAGGNLVANKDTYIVGDYLGDSRADFAVMRRANSGVDAVNATWYILENGGAGQVVVRQFGYGAAGPEIDEALCGDYNGDGKNDMAVYRNGTFLWLNSPGFETVSKKRWGAVGLPVAKIHTLER